MRKWIIVCQPPGNGDGFIVGYFDTEREARADWHERRMPYTSVVTLRGWRRFYKGMRTRYNPEWGLRIPLYSEN